MARCRVRGRGLRCAPPQELPCLAAPVCTHSRASRWDPDTSTAEGPLRGFNGFAQGPAQVRGSQARVNCTWNLPFPCWSPAPSGAWGGPLARPRPAGWGPAAPGSESTCSSDQALSPFTFQSRGGATSRRPSHADGQRQGPRRLLQPRRSRHLLGGQLASTLEPLLHRAQRGDPGAGREGSRGAAPAATQPPAPPGSSRAETPARSDPAAGGTCGVAPAPTELGTNSSRGLFLDQMGPRMKGGGSP